MAWLQTEINIGEITVKCSINSSGEKTRIEMPFDVAFLDATELTINGKQHKIESITNVGGRDETLLTEVIKNESQKRRTKDKTGEE